MGDDRSMKVYEIFVLKLKRSIKTSKGPLKTLFVGKKQFVSSKALFCEHYIVGSASGNKGAHFPQTNHKPKFRN